MSQLIQAVKLPYGKIMVSDTFHFSNGTIYIPYEKESEKIYAISASQKIVMALSNIDSQPEKSTHD